MIHRLFALIASIVLVGCASGPAKLPVDNLAASEKTPVTDVRPVIEGTREIFSAMLFSERYGYIRLAQDVTDPTGPRLFTHLLQEKYGPEVVPPTKLRHFAVYINAQSESRRIALGAGFGGVIGAVIASGGAKREGDAIHTMADAARFAAESGDNEFKRARFTDPEIAAGVSVYVIYIESESQQNRRFTRTVWPIKAVKEGEKIPLHQAMEAAIRFNLNP